VLTRRAAAEVADVDQDHEPDRRRDHPSVVAADVEHVGDRSLERLGGPPHQRQTTGDPDREQAGEAPRRCLVDPGECGDEIAGSR
jgi:hypothetical protein